MYPNTKPVYLFISNWEKLTRGTVSLFDSLSLLKLQNFRKSITSITHNEKQMPISGGHYGVNPFFLWDNG